MTNFTPQSLHGVGLIAQSSRVDKHDDTLGDWLTQIMQFWKGNHRRYFNA